METACWILGRCSKKVNPKNKGHYICAHCGTASLNPELRYCLKVIVTDGTRYINLLIWNTEGKIIVGKTANEVWELSDSEKQSNFESCLETTAKSGGNELRLKMGLLGSLALKVKVLIVRL
ncbi:Replication factor A protein 1 [Stylosanthes scabra]|uniref:Replication factor A protein 1 n=1 Tax=Stylosanthes scabra TaxID=79078 RepID=A0ABU6QCU2_9FABA|nr:Replication factor A protein 1 [Stylosanthes scabra]